MRVALTMAAVLVVVATTYGQGRGTPPPAPPVKRLRVVDRDAVTTGISSEIRLVDGHDVETRLKPTSADGYFTVDVPCADGSRIKAVPTNAFYMAGSIECPAMDQALVKVWRVPYFTTMSRNAKAAEAQNPAVAAWLYNEIAGRMVGADAKAADAATIKTLELFGRTLGVDKATVFDPGQKKFVMSDELFSAVVEFQQQEGLPADGVLGVKTLEKATPSHAPLLLYMMRNDIELDATWQKREAAPKEN